MRMLILIGMMALGTIIPATWFLMPSNDLNLIDASRTGDINRVRYLLDHGIDVNQRGRNGGTPLFYAVGNDHVDVAAILISSGASLEAVDERGVTALFANLQNEQESLEMLKFLVSKGANVNHRDRNGMTPLFASVDIGGSLRKTRYLLETGADPNQQSEIDGDFPLRIAVSWQNLELVAVLLDYGANPNMQRRDGDTALMEACRQDNIEVVKVLLGNGADTSLKNRNGLSALAFANKDSTELRTLLENNNK
jgi:ankyrin repeat protein